jgi:hypothetical protein
MRVSNISWFCIDFRLGRFFSAQKRTPATKAGGDLNEVSSNFIHTLFLTENLKGRVLLEAISKTFQRRVANLEKEHPLFTEALQKTNKDLNNGKLS